MDLSAPFRRLWAWFRQQNRVARDLIVTGVVGLPLYLLAVWFDALDKFLAFTNEPQSDAIDWLIILIVFLGIAAKIFSARRVVDLHREVAERRKSEVEAYKLARHDVLTGLPNRRWFIEDFDTGDQPAARGRGLRAVRHRSRQFQADQRRLRPRLGDEVLRVVARRLTKLAEGGSVARLGGDEFGIILRYPRSAATLPSVWRGASCTKSSKPIPLAALALQVGVSVGVATSCSDGAATPP